MTAVADCTEKICDDDCGYAPTNTSTPWRNPDSGNAGQITPIETYQAKSGKYCREYRQTVWVGGKEQQAYGTACRQPDGSWKIIR